MHGKQASNYDAEHAEGEYAARCKEAVGQWCKDAAWVHKRWSEA